MARLELKRSLRPASCCRVEVMNGADGERRNGFSVTERDREGHVLQSGGQSPGLVLVQHHHRRAEVSAPFSSKSRPEARATPSTEASAAVNDRGTSPVERRRRRRRR